MRTFRFRAFGLDARREHEFTFGVEARDEEQAWLRACAYVGSIDFCCHELDLLEG